MDLSLRPRLGPASTTIQPETIALYERMSPKPDAARLALINACITSLKAAGVWAKLDCLWFTAAHDAQAACLNWISSSYTLTPVSSPTFTADRGYAGNGTTSYLNTSWNPASSTLFLQDSASIGVYLNAGTDTANISASVMGVNDASTGANLSPWVTTNTVRGRMNISAPVTYPGTITTRLGFTALSRTGAAVTNRYRNSSKGGDETTASTGRPSGSLYLCCVNSNGTPSSFLDNRVAFAFAGAGLSQAEMLALYNAANTLLTAIGAN